MALITKGISMTWDETVNATRPSSTVISLIKTGNPHYKDGVFTFYNLMEIGEIGVNSAGASGYDQIEVTTLADHKHMFVDGLLANNSDSADEITLKFLFTPELFDTVNKIVELEGNDLAFDSTSGLTARESIYKFNIPNGGAFTVEGTFANLKMDSAAVNSALTFTVALKVASISYDKA